MSDPTRPFLQPARNNLLANRSLLIAMVSLQAHEWTAPRTGFFPSPCATLNHFACVDLFHIDALEGGIDALEGGIDALEGGIDALEGGIDAREGGTLGPAAFAADIPCPDPATLAQAQTALDHRALTICITLTPDRLSHPVNIHRTTCIQTGTVADTLMHLFLHSQHRRGQAHAMLSGTSAAAG